MGLYSSCKPGACRHTFMAGMGQEDAVYEHISGDLQALRRPEICPQEDIYAPKLHRI